MAHTGFEIHTPQASSVIPQQVKEKESTEVHCGVALGLLHKQKLLTCREVSQGRDEWEAMGAGRQVAEPGEEEAQG